MHGFCNKMKNKTKQFAKEWSKRHNLYCHFFIFRHKPKRMLKAGFHLKDVLTSLNMAFVLIPRSRVKQRRIPLFKTLTNVLRFCVNFWLIFGHFGKEIIFLN